MTFPANIIPRLALWGFIFTLGLLVGNRWETAAAIEREHQASADRQRENHQLLIAWTKDVERKLKTEAAQQHAADMAAAESWAKGKANSDAALFRARAQLKTLETAQQQKLAEVRDETKALPPAPGCVLPPSLRQSLNAAIGSLNNRPDVGYSEAPPTRLPDGTSSTVAPVTCGELVGSMTDILEHDAMLTAWVLSWQRWAYEALK